MRSGVKSSKFVFRRHPKFIMMQIDDLQTRLGEKLAEPLS